MLSEAVMVWSAAVENLREPSQVRDGWRNLEEVLCTTNLEEVLCATNLEEVLCATRHEKDE